MHVEDQRPKIPKVVGCCWFSLVFRPEMVISWTSWDGWSKTPHIGQHNDPFFRVPCCRGELLCKERTFFEDVFDKCDGDASGRPMAIETRNRKNPPECLWKHYGNIMETRNSSVVLLHRHLVYVRRPLAIVRSSNSLDHPRAYQLVTYSLSAGRVALFHVDPKPHAEEARHPNDGCPSHLKPRSRTPKTNAPKTRPTPKLHDPGSPLAHRPFRMTRIEGPLLHRANLRQPILN